MSPNEKMVYKTSLKMIRSGSVLPAAQMLEQAGLFRDSIAALEKANLLHEAAAVLLRMQKPNRAAAIYCRHQWWTDAARCFTLAGEHENAAKCLVLAGNHSEAAEIYLKIPDLLLAAESFEIAGNFEAAANCWLKAKNLQKTARCLVAISKNEALVPRFNPSKPMLDFLFIAFQNADLNGPIIAPLAKSEHVASMIFKLIGDNRTDLAVKLFVLAHPDTANVLLRDVKTQGPLGKRLAVFFTLVNEFAKAGVLFEQIGLLSEAESAFHAAGDAVRAEYCRKRNGQKLGLSAPPESSQSTGHAVQNNVNLPKSHGAGFSIYSETNTKNASVGMASPRNLSTSTVDPSLSAAEIDLFMKSPLLNGTNPAVLEQFLAIFSALNYPSSELFSCGTDDQMLMLQLSGAIDSAEGKASPGLWLCPEQCLALGVVTIWTVKAPAKLLSVGKESLDRFFEGNSAFTRKVYTNLTRTAYRKSS